MAYATVSDVEARTATTFTEQQESICTALLADAAVIIDRFALSADDDVKKLVSIRMVLRCMGGDDMPIGVTQGSQAALGYSTSWTYGNGANGELYLSKMDKNLLGGGNKIGSYSPVEGMVPQC